MKTCFNHPEKEALSVCHGCGKDYCEQCLDEGEEYYYCKKPGCQKLLKEELHPEILPDNVICPNCKRELKPTKKEKADRKVHCPGCDVLIDYNNIPPTVLNSEKYVELLSSINQGDVALIESILQDGNIDYYMVGENFLSMRPAIEPVRFFVNETQKNSAVELLKNLDFHIWAFSTNQIK